MIGTRSSDQNYLALQDSATTLSGSILLFSYFVHNLSANHVQPFEVAEVVVLRIRAHAASLLHVSCDCWESIYRALLNGVAAISGS